MGMLLAIVSIALVVAVSGYAVSKYRINDHIYQYYSGTFKLIGEGVARHKNQEREQWLSAIERLSGLDIEIHRFDEQLLSKGHLGKLINDKFLFLVDNQLVTSRAYILLPEEQQYLSILVDDYGTSLVRISAFLMLNELGRHRNEAKLSALNHLRSLYRYPIALMELSAIKTGAANLRSIKKGEVTVVLNISGATESNMMAYAPIGNSRYVLQLGEIPLFEWLPLSHLIAVILFTLTMMAAAIFYLVKPLENRLAEVDDKIVAIAQDQEIVANIGNSPDAITKLSNTVDSMANRIQRLLIAQTDMVRAISHELRAPITRIRFQLAVMQDEVNTESHANGIEKNLDELEHLIDEVLTFLKLKSCQPKLKAEATDGKTFLTYLVKQHANINPDINITMECEAAEPLVADRRYLYRAIANLLINALKYADANVAVGYRIQGQRYQIWVADDGPGIPVEQRSEVFTPFKRLDASRARQSGGYGLGLSIVQQVAVWHQGEVEIQESALGGSLMLFSWPIPRSENDQIS